MIYQHPERITDQQVAQLTPSNIKVTNIEITMPDKKIKDSEIKLLNIKITKHDYAQ